MPSKTTAWKLTKQQASLLKYYRDGTPSNAATRVINTLLERGLIEWHGSIREGNFKLTRSGEHALKTYETGIWS